jgi:hypothetical protein
MPETSAEIEARTGHPNTREWWFNNPAPGSVLHEQRNRSSGGSSSTNAYASWLARQRLQMQQLISHYREQLPGLLEGWQQGATRSLGDATKSFRRGAATNLTMRGLHESPGFIAGADLDRNSFYNRGMDDILSQRQGFEGSAISNMLNAVGSPDYGSLTNAFQAWQSQVNAINQQNYENQTQERIRDAYGQTDNRFGTERLRDPWNVGY